MSRDHLIHYLHAQGYDRDGIARILYDRHMAQGLPRVKISWLRAEVTKTLNPHDRRRGPRYCQPEPATTG